MFCLKKTAATEIYTLTLHDAVPITVRYPEGYQRGGSGRSGVRSRHNPVAGDPAEAVHLDTLPHAPGPCLANSPSYTYTKYFVCLCTGLAIRCVPIVSNGYPLTFDLSVNMVKVSISLPNNTQITFESEESEVLHEVVGMVLRDLPRDLMRSPSDSGRNTAGATADKSTTAVASADRKSTRLNSSNALISYAVCCLKKKKKKQ